MYRLDKVFSDIDSPCIVFRRGIEHDKPKATVGYMFKLFIVNMTNNERKTISPRKLYELAEKDKVVGVVKLDDYLCISVMSQRAAECLNLVNCVGMMSTRSLDDKFMSGLSYSDKEKLVDFKRSHKRYLNKIDLNIWTKEFGVFVPASFYISGFIDYNGKWKGSYRIFESVWADRLRVLNESNILDAVLYSDLSYIFYNNGKNFLFPVSDGSVYKYCVFECSPKLLLEVCS